MWKSKCYSHLSYGSRFSIQYSLFSIQNTIQSTMAFSFLHFYLFYFFFSFVHVFFFYIFFLLETALHYVFAFLWIFLLSFSWCLCKGSLLFDVQNRAKRVHITWPMDGNFFSSVEDMHEKSISHLLSIPKSKKVTQSFCKTVRLSVCNTFTWIEITIFDLNGFVKSPVKGHRV